MCREPNVSENRLWMRPSRAGRMLESTGSWRTRPHTSVAGEALQVEERLLRIALRSEQLAVGVGGVGLEAAADLG